MDEAIFHLAIPCTNLEMAADFYQRLGCRVARRYDDRITIDFWGHQVVCHLSPEHCAPESHKYPRHFGLTFATREAFDALYNTAEKSGLKILRKTENNFSGQPEEHLTFCLSDPSNNVLEFKYYFNKEMRY